MRRFALATFLAALSPLAAAQPDDPMAAYIAAAAPDEHHELMGRFAGNHTFRLTFWPAPGAPPETMEGRSSSVLALGGRYLLSEITGDMGGMPFEGRATTAYDRTAGAYVSTWIDNMSTSIMVFRGQEEDGAMVMRGPFVDPVTHAPQIHRTVDRPTDDGGYVTEYYVEEDGVERKTMEIVYSPGS